MKAPPLFACLKPLKSFQPGWAKPFVLLAVLSLASASHGGLVFTKLASFAYTNGANPNGTLVQASDGLFYGTTIKGRGNTNSSETCGGAGTVFRMTASGVVSSLASFDCTNGNEAAGLVQGIDGNFYGATLFGGAYNFGTVFRVTPTGVLSMLCSLDGTNGVNPCGRLVQGIDGNLYGTAEFGGPGYNGSQVSGLGTVFRVTTNGILSSVIRFSGTNGAGPVAGLIQGRAGDFYGSTSIGGPLFDHASQVSGFGTVFRLTTNGDLTMLAAFSGTNGRGVGELLQGVDGNLYGVTEMGGIGFDPSTMQGNGTVFRLSSNGTLTSLVLFAGTNGAYPGGLVQGPDGNFYGPTAWGGTGYSGATYSGNGTIFKLTPGGALTTLVILDPTTGTNPYDALVLGTDGNFYGTTATAGDANYGTVFRLSVPMAPTFHSITRIGATLGLTWDSVASQAYQLQYTTDLASGGWSNLGSIIIATNGLMSASDTISPDGQRFYRAVLLP